MGSSGPDLRSRIRELTSADRSRLLLEPEGVLGPYEDLPAADRRGLRAAIEGRDAAATRGYEGLPGRAHERVLRAASRLRARHARWQRDGRVGGFLGRPLGNALTALMFGIRRAPEFGGIAAHSALEALRSLAASRDRGSLAGLLARRSVQPHCLAVCYARPLAQRPRFRAFWRDAAGGREVGCIVGLDLIPTDDGCHVIECNLEAAQRPDRVALYDRDPLVENLVAHAARSGCRRLMVLDNRSGGTLPATARGYRERAAEAGLEVILVDRAYLPESPNLRSYPIPRDLPPETLVVRFKAYPVATDYLLADKFGCHRALKLYQQATGDRSFLLPEAGTEPVVGDRDLDRPFPNVVAKQSDLDRGMGVRFAKARSPEHAREIFRRAGPAGGKSPLRERLKDRLRSPRHMYQAYVPPPLLEDRRTYAVRSHVLVSPGEVVFLSAHRVISGLPVPEELPSGIVEDRYPFLASFPSGARYEKVPPEEGERVKAASVAVGRGLSWALQRSFRCSPAGGVESAG